jgi:uncharacterized protein YcnI
MSRRIVLASAMAGAIVCMLAAPAAAHVTVDPPSAPQGSTVKLSFLVPNEETSLKVTKVQIVFPTPPATPIASVAVGQKPGWTSTVTKQTLAKPIVTDDGNITKVVQEIDWKANTPADAIPAGQFGEFTIDADGLPDNGDQVVFKAIQTYTNGDKVSWIDPVTKNGPAAEHPTPILELTNPGSAATPTTAASTSDGATIAADTSDNSARALGIIGIALGAVALVFASGALLRKRRA